MAEDDGPDDPPAARSDDESDSPPADSQSDDSDDSASETTDSGEDKYPAHVDGPDKADDGEDAESDHHRDQEQKQDTEQDAEQDTDQDQDQDWIEQSEEWARVDEESERMNYDTEEAEPDADWAPYDEPESPDEQADDHEPEPVDLHDYEGHYSEDEMADFEDPRDQVSDVRAEVEEPHGAGPGPESRDAGPGPESHDAGPGASASTGAGAGPSGPPGAGTPAGAGASGGAAVGGGGARPAAPDDQEMPLAVHIEEMVSRLGVVFVVVALVSGVVFPFSERFINFLWYSFLPGTFQQCPTLPTANSAGQVEVACPTLYHPLALIFARLKMASLAGFVIGLPVLVYESYLFMRPGLYPRERRYYLASVPTSLVLALIGVSFAYFLVLPVLFDYFTVYTSSAADIYFGLTETFNLIVMMMGFFALVFQIPLLIMLGTMMGVTSRRWLINHRLYFWGGFATVAFFFSPDPTGMAPILVAATMIVLFEGTLLLLGWTGDDSLVPSGEALAARRPFVWLATGVVGYLLSSVTLPSGYYDQLPPGVREQLAALGLTQATPLVIGVALILVYEVVAYAMRRVDADDRLVRTLSRGRVLVWPLFLLIGYFGSPNPTLVARANALGLPLARVAVVVGGLIVAYELLAFGLKRRG